MSSSSVRRRVPLPSVVAWAVFATYFVAARGAANLFPISSFGMYQGRAPDVVSRLVVVDQAGRTSAIDDFDAFHCAPARPVLADESSLCGQDHRGLEYVVRNQQVYLDDHLALQAARGAEPISIVSRAYRVRSEAPSRPSEDCVMARCTARRLDGAR